MALQMPTILVVDDELLIRMALSDALEDKGYRVFEAGCVLEAIAILAHHEIDALVTDIDMPGGLSGIDLAWLVARARKKTGIIVVSGDYSPTGCDLPTSARFFAKPYRHEDIISALGETAQHIDVPAHKMAI
jgi:CheY-like chemotaxis protein